MLALYIASKGGNTFHNVQDQLPADGQANVTLVEGSVAVAWRVIKLRAKSIFTPPWQLFLRSERFLSLLQAVKSSLPAPSTQQKSKPISHMLLKH